MIRRHEYGQRESAQLWARRRADRGLIADIDEVLTEIEKQVDGLSRRTAEVLRGRPEDRTKGLPR